MPNPQTYFASEGPDKIAGELWQRVQKYYQHLKDSGLASLVYSLHAALLGQTTNGTGGTSFRITKGGEQGELLNSVENHLSSIGNALVTLTTAQRPAIQYLAANSDYKSLAQTSLAQGIGDWWLTERQLEQHVKEAVRKAVRLMEGHILVEWSATEGEDVMARESDEGEMLGGLPEKTGDIRNTVLGILDVVRDVYATSWEALDWLIVRQWVNRYDLAAKYPEHVDAILALTPAQDVSDRIGLGSTLRSADTALIPMWKFFHKRTAAVPEGRMVSFVDDNTVLFDGANPYRDELPVKRVVADEIDGTPFGFTPMAHLLSLQEAVNGLDSSMITNALGRGVGNMVTNAPDGSVTVEEVSSSMNLIKTPPGSEVKALEWPDMPSEFANLKAAKISAMEVISGANSVVRGNPSENVGEDASGAKLALIAAQAIQANSGLESSYANLLRDICLAIINRYKDFGGSVPRLARLAGKNRQYMVKEFTASDLEDVDRVSVDVGSPMMRTVSGRMAIADKAMSYPKAEDRMAYLHLIKEGTLDPGMEDGHSQSMRIRQENELMMEGQRPRVLVSDPHWLEIKKHLSILDNPSLREPAPENEAIASVVLGHVQEHLMSLKTMDPTLVLAVGGQEALAFWQPAMAAAMPPGVGGPPPPEPGATSGTPPPEAGAESVVEPSNPAASQEEMPGEPEMPNNPMTGEQYAPPGALQS